jgi:hypothetical protein
MGKGRQYSGGMPHLLLAAICVCAAVLPAQSADRPVVITLERTTCFGTCPAYSLQITGDGRVEYEGRQFVRLVGKAETTISPEAVSQLVAEFERIHYFDLEDKYTGGITDLPTTTTSIRIGSRFKQVVDYYRAPAALKALEQRIDEVAGSKRWVASGPAEAGHYFPGKNDGSGRSRIVCSPGAAPITLGIEFTTIDAVATSPWIPPASFMESFGEPSISTESYDSGAPRYASMCSRITGSPFL